MPQYFLTSKLIIVMKQITFDSNPNLGDYLTKQRLDIAEQLAAMQLRLQFGDSDKPNFKFPIKNVNDLVVKMTYDYSKFNSSKGNRTVSPKHLSNLKKSMINDYLFTCIFVNENFDIIDGHHRFEIIKELRYPLFYIILEGYGIEQLRLYNKSVKVWNVEDILSSFCALEYPEYMKVRAFKDKYPFSWNSIKRLLSLGTTFNRTEFESGKYVIPNLKKSISIAEGISSLSEVFEGYNNRYFISAMLKLMLSENVSFDLSEFKDKLRLNPYWLRSSVRIEDYLSDIERIYNWKRREKVSLRFV